MSTLQDSIAMKKDEILSMELRLKSPDYTDKEWPKKEIALLTGEIEVSQRYLKKEGELTLAKCSNAGYTCMVAHIGFSTGCIFARGRCEFRHKVEIRQAQLI